MKSLGDSTNSQQAELPPPDLAQWAAEIDGFLSKVRCEIRQIRETLMTKTGGQELSSSRAGDMVTAVVQLDEPPVPGASDSARDDLDPDAFESLKRRLADRLERCAAAADNERTDDLPAEENR